jgi:hypothetical protein
VQRLANESNDLESMRRRNKQRDDFASGDATAQMLVIERTALLNANPSRSANPAKPKPNRRFRPAL